ncbi:MAG: DUF3887 domain-containing protein [Cyanobacteriota bacterium]|nr:DUF3887 domain-containing protein [Cyanobacteriota bacterium]
MVYLRCLKKLGKTSFAVTTLAIAIAGGTGAIVTRASEISPQPSSSSIVQAPSLQSLAEEFVDAMATDDMERARGFLHPTLQEELSTEDLRQNWEELIAVTGKFQERLSSSAVEDPSGNENLVLVSIRFANVTDDLIVIFNDEREAIGFDFPEVE